jgi:hypothetical protein
VKLPKPRRAGGDIVTVTPGTDDAHAEMHDGNFVNAETPHTGGRGNKIVNLVKPAVAFSVITTTIIVALGVSLNGTIIATVPLEGDAGVIAVRGKFPVGQIPTGETVLVSSAPNGNPLQKVQQMWAFPDGKVVTVAAGPSGVVTVRGGETFYNNTRVDLPPAGLKKTILNGTYLTVCVKGACTAGEVVEVPQGNIIGSVTKYFTHPFKKGA